MNREFKKDEVIFRQGDYAGSMFDILAGSVGIYAAYGTEHEKQLTVLGEGQLMGEMGLIEAYPRSATAVAMEDGTRLQEIDEKEFSAYFYERPERLLLIMQQISQRLRDRTADYEDALGVLRELKGTPDKRSKSFLGRLRELLGLYDEMMAAGVLVPYEGMASGYPFTMF